MYKKELKDRFMEMVLLQADLVAQGCNERESFWICVYYTDALNSAALIMEHPESCLKLLSIIKFRHIFKSICEYRKGLDNVTAAQYARTTRPTMEHASEQLVKDYH